jgi:hypothetical protein
MDVTVFGKIRDNDGNPAPGAIIKFALEKSFSSGGIYHHNNERRAVTNKYGLFEILLPPSTLDPSKENYYIMTIVYGNVTTSRVIVPESTEEINFADLAGYKFPYERHEEIGGGYF